MARTLSSNIQTQIQSEGIRIAHLLKLEDLGASNTDLVVTNHVKDLTYNSITYQAGGNIQKAKLTSNDVDSLNVGDPLEVYYLAEQPKIVYSEAYFRNKR